MSVGSRSSTASSTSWLHAARQVGKTTAMRARAASLRQRGRYETAPISEYCEIRTGYGGTTNYTVFNSGNPYTCGGTSVWWLPVDHAVWVR